MAKWKCEICGNEFDNFHAQGFDNKIYCPLCYFKKKYENAVADYETTMAEKNKLEQQCKKQKEVIDKIKDLLTIKKSRCLNEDDYILNAFDLDEILDILKEG